MVNNTEYTDILVKEIYEKYPEISYPMITIEELTNEDNQQYFNGTEQVSLLAYQIGIHCEQSVDKTARQNARLIGDLVDSYLKGERYRCLRRIGSFPITPMINDENVMIGYLRYECNLDIQNNIIYRR